MTKIAVLPVRMLSIIALMAVAAPSAALAQPASTPVSLPAVQYKLTRLAPPQTSAQAVFPVDEAQRVTVTIIANDGALNTSILGPAGQLVNPTTVEALGGAFSAVTGAPADSPLLLSMPPAGFQYQYTFPSLGAGNYTVRFDTASAAEVAVITELATDSRIGATLLATDPALVLGNPAVLTAALFDGSTALAGATVAVNVVFGTGPTASLLLQDDGAGADDRAGDGLYSGEFTPSATGRYLASAVITGMTPAGVSFTRHAATSFEVLPRRSALSGTFADDGVDDDGNGSFDRVRVLVHTTTTQEGRYRAFVHLRTALGQGLVRSGEADLFVSSPGVPVDFDAESLRQLNENGPYNVELIELLFVDAAEASLADSVENAGQTRAYLLSQFERPTLAATGRTVDQAVDDDTNGKFDRLVVSVEVDVRLSGFYSWGFKLSDALAREIDFASGAGFFNPGLNQLTVTFQGALIGASGANGPYQLRDLLVQGPGTSLVLVEVGATTAYRFTEFEGAVSNQPPVADAGPDQTVEAAGATGTPVALDGSASADPDGDPLTYEWRDAGGNIVATTPTADVSLPLGGHTFTLVVSDQRGGTASDTVVITVRDTTPPVVSELVASPNVMWPPNHKLVPIALAAVVADAVDPGAVCEIASVTSNEPQDGLGDGDTSPDWVATGEMTVALRAERSGNGPGRVYSISVRCNDSSGNASTRTVAVTVPRNR